jgi:hypothetical protein
MCVGGFVFCDEDYIPGASHGLPLSSYPTGRRDGESPARRKEAPAALGSSLAMQH